VNLEISPVLDSALQCALLVAQRFGSYVEGLHMRPGQPDIIAAGADGFVAAAPDLVASFEREARDRAERARTTFEAFMAQHALPRATGLPPGSGICADWRIEVTSGHGAIGSLGRVFDLVVMGRPLSDSVAPSMAALETALFESGRPLLIAPPTPPASMGEHILLAWNCSTETARAVALAMPLLERASRVVVLTVEGGTVAGPTGEQLAKRLVLNGVAAEALTVSPGPLAAGPAILEQATALGADLIIKGAYTQSRLRQMIFGGATSHLLSAATVPVFMAH
jgi:nucleotide-binding universal stress UspA family protein